MAAGHAALADAALTTPGALRSLEVFKDCDACPEMIVMPPGAFMMGAKPGESRNRFDIYGKDATGGVRGPDAVNIIPSEHPRHLVEMDIAYAIARNETTYAEWMACVADKGCSTIPAVVPRNNGRGPSLTGQGGTQAISRFVQQSRGTPFGAETRSASARPRQRFNGPSAGKPLK